MADSFCYSNSQIMKKLILLCCSLILFTIKGFSQTIPVGDYAEELARMNQLLGISDDLSSFTQRPVNSVFNSVGDSSLQSFIASKNLVPNAKLLGSQVSIKILPFTWLSDYNTKTPFGYNDEVLYPNVGYQTMVSGGIFIKAGILNIQFKPQFVYAQNKPFQTFPKVEGAAASAALLTPFYHVINGIDAPERFGSASINHFYPGESKITLVYKNVELGVSTENLWWGPGIQNSIMMSNSAPGFLHWTFNSANPIKTCIGSFEWQLIGGELKQSGYPPSDLNYIPNNSILYKPKVVVSRYISAFTADWQPKWIDGLFLGVSAYNYLNKNATYDALSTFKKYFTVFSNSSDAANSVKGGDGQDFAYAINLRQVLTKYNAEIYFQYARNDRAGNLTDLFLEPEHSAAYMLGASKFVIFPRNQFLKLSFELTHLEIPYTYLLRAEPTWYTHPDTSPSDGYTNQGRYVGAGIGPGSNSLSFDISYIKNTDSYGVRFERYVHDNDLYNYANAETGNLQSPWVDFSTTFYAKKRFNKYFVSFEISPTSNLNYEYLPNYSVFNLNSRLTLTYLF